MNLVWCDKQYDSANARCWHVVLILDDEDKVKDHGVTTGQLWDMMMEIQNKNLEPNGSH